MISEMKNQIIVMLFLRVLVQLLMTVELAQVKMRALVTFSITCLKEDGNWLFLLEN